MPKNSNISIKTGTFNTLFYAPESTALGKKYIYNVYNGYNCTITISGIYIKISTTAGNVHPYPPLVGDTIYVYYTNTTGGTYNGGTYDSNILNKTYTVSSFSYTNSTDIDFYVIDSTAYNVISGGASVVPTTDSTIKVVINNPFLFSITSITASSGSVKFTFNAMDDSFKPDVEDEIYITGWISSSATVNINKSYVVTSVDKVNNYFLANDSVVYNALNTGTTATAGDGSATSLSPFSFIKPLKIGELALFNGGRSTITTAGNRTRLCVNNNSSSEILKSVPMKFTSGRNYYTPFLGGNLSTLTCAVNNFYFVPFIVSNTTTFSTATLVTKTNTSTNIGFAIYDSNGAVPGNLLVSGGGTSAASWSLASTNANIVNSTDNFNFGGLTRTTSGLQLPAGIYFIGIINRASATTLTPNSGVGYGVIPDSDNINFFPPGCLVNTSYGATSTVFPLSASIMSPLTSTTSSGYDTTVKEVPLIYLTAVSTP